MNRLSWKEWDAKTLPEIVERVCKKRDQSMKPKSNWRLIAFYLLAVFLGILLLGLMR